LHSRDTEDFRCGPVNEVVTCDGATYGDG
jgi:hypothetical protein